MAKLAPPLEGWGCDSGNVCSDENGCVQGDMAVDTCVHLHLLLQLFLLHSVATKEPSPTPRVESHDARYSSMIPTPYQFGLHWPQGIRAEIHRYLTDGRT